VTQAVQKAVAQRKIKYTLPYTSIAERQTMSVLLNIGKTHAEIASILNCSKKTVQRQMKKFQQTQSFSDENKTGRPSKLTEEIRAQILSWVEEDRRNASSKLASMVKESFGVDVSERFWNGLPKVQT
jgi:transposase